MGAEPYWYFVKHQPNVQKALDELREREFRAGRYNPATAFLTFPVSDSDPGPGCQHDSIEEAMEEADADGTRSILDIERVADEPDFCVASPLERDLLEDLYGTAQPTRRMLEENMDFLEDIERVCDHVVIIDQGRLVIDQPLTGMGTPQGDLLVRIDGNQEAFIAQMAARGIPVRRPTDDDLQTSDELIVASNAPEIYDAVRDVTAELGVGLRSLRMKGRSLEDLYLGNVGGGNG